MRNLLPLITYLLIMVSDKKIIFLTGQMGAGKSFLGAKIAAHLGLHFLDTDQVISIEQEQTINTIFEKQGELAFRDMESALLKRILEEESSCVVATGGGFPCFNNNAQEMYNKALVIHIKASEELLELNLKSGIAHRPLINKPGLKLHEFLEKQYDSRKSHYEKAHIFVSLNSRNEGFKHLIDRLTPFF